jgi:putative lipoprotein
MVHRTSAGRPRAIFTLVLAAALSSCAHTAGTSSANSAGSSGGASGASEPVAGLSGITWRFYDTGKDTLADASKTEMRIDTDGKVSGSTGCNRFTGTAAIVGTSLTFAPLATTRMACDPALMKQESAILAALQSVKSFALVGSDRLNLLDAGGQPVVRLVTAKP